MAFTENELVEVALRESKDFAKAIRQYLFDMGQQRPLTKQEQRFYDLTHEIHVKTNDALLILNEQKEEGEILL